MPDIFLSYSREDQATARRFAEGLQREGFDVWWDQSLRSGESYDEVTEQALKGARAVVVLWSKTSVASRWVRAEATIADRAGTLVPVMIEPCERPVMFELRQSADLSGWQGANDTRWSAFVDDLRHRLQRPQVPGAEALPVRATSSRRTAAVGFGLIALAVLLAGAWWMHAHRAADAPAQRASDSPPTAERPVTLAVLPFANLSSDPEQEFFADGLTEELVNSLARIDGLQVTSRTSAFYFKGRNEELRAIGEKLGVEHLLEGSVRRNGDVLRITAQLVKAKDGFHLWSQTYDRSQQDLFNLQEDIARNVAKALEVALGVGDIGQRPGLTRDVEAYQLFWQADALEGASDARSLARQAQLLEEAVARDPDFVLARSALSWVYFNSAQHADPGRREEFLARADAALQEAKARNRDPRLLLDRTDERLLPRGKWSEMEQMAMARAAAGVDGTERMDLYLMGVDKHSRAIEQLEALRTRDPLNARVAINLAEAYAAAGRVAEAEAEQDRGLGIAYNPATVLGQVLLAKATGNQAREEQGWQRLLAATKDPEDEFRKLHALRNQPAEGVAFVRAQAERLGAREATRLANWAAYFGDHGLALQLLVQGDNPDLRFPATYTYWRPIMAGARRLPGFKDVVIKAGLVDYWREFGWGEHCRPLGDTDFECR